MIVNMDIKTLSWAILIFLIVSHQVSGLECYNCLYFSTGQGPKNDDQGGLCKPGGASLPDSYLGVGGISINVSLAEGAGRPQVVPACAEVIAEGIWEDGEVKSSVAVRVGLLDTLSNSTTGSCVMNKSYHDWRAGGDYVSRVVSYMLSNSTLSDNSTVSGCLCREDKCNSKLSLKQKTTSSAEPEGIGMLWQMDLTTFVLSGILLSIFVLVVTSLVVCRCCQKTREWVAKGKGGEQIRYSPLDNNTSEL